MSKIFGGSKSKSKSKSYNRSFDTINQSVSPLIQQGVTANNNVNRLLGGDASQFNSFKDAVNFDFEALRGIDDVNSQYASKGVFRSGARDKALAEFNQGISGRYAQLFLNSLMGQSSQGLQAGNLLTNAGRVAESEGSSSSSPGLGGFIGGGLSLLAGGK